MDWRAELKRESAAAYDDDDGDPDRGPGDG